MKSVVIAALLFASQTAQAQPGNVAPARVDRVDEDVALGLSLGGTVLSWGLLISSAYMNNDQGSGSLATVGAIGTMFAPSFGHWYAHKPLTRGMGIRALGVVAGAVGFSLVLDDLFEEDGDNEGPASVLLLLGAGLYVAGTVDDIGTAASTARAYNARFQDVAVVPTVSSNGGGFAVMGRF